MMLLTTTSSIENQPVQKYFGIVTGEVIVGANVFRDLFAQVRDFVGGRSRSYEDALREARLQALAELKSAAFSIGANAVIGIDYECAVVGRSGSMLMVCITGTAVKL